jgi:Glyoxalase/Bleomycin resistance protein/Dioxygenase superfamily
MSVGMDLPELGVPFHTGFIVHDLDAVMASWARLGVRWAEAIRSSGWWQVGDERCELTMGVVYSTATDHHLELVAPDDPSLFGLGSAAPAHHVGYFVDDVPQVAALLRDAGFPIVLSRHADQDDPDPTLTYHRVPGTDVHVELAPASLRGVIEAWTRTGRFPRGEMPSITVVDG